MLEIELNLNILQLFFRVYFKYKTVLIPKLKNFEHSNALSFALLACFML